eukprot:5347865-Alexandrium_andersonii.AAC.1
MDQSSRTYIPVWRLARQQDRASSSWLKQASSWRHPPGKRGCFPSRPPGPPPLRSAPWPRSPKGRARRWVGRTGGECP